MDTAPGSRCAGCGEPLEPGRSHKRYHRACRQKAYRQRQLEAAREMLEREALVIEQGLEPEEALLWVIFPEAMRARHMSAVAA